MNTAIAHAEMNEAVITQRERALGKQPKPPIQNALMFQKLDQRRYVHS